MATGLEVHGKTADEKWLRIARCGTTVGDAGVPFAAAPPTGFVVLTASRALCSRGGKPARWSSRLRERVTSASRRRDVDVTPAEQVSRFIDPLFRPPRRRRHRAVPQSFHRPLFRPPRQQLRLQPRSGGTLRLAITAQPPGLGRSPAGVGLLETVWFVYDRLTAYDDKLRAAADAGRELGGQQQ